MKRFLPLFLILLILHIGVVIPKTKFTCSCHDLSSEVFSACCNCSYCVSQRGGFLSSCGCHERTGSSPENLPSVKRALCFCGSSGSDFELPGVKYPVLVAENIFSLPLLEVHHFLSTPSALSLQVYLTPPDHPS
jgi:hypothetical protein